MLPPTAPSLTFTPRGSTFYIMQIVPHRFLSPRALAEAIGVSESSLKRWADEGRLAVERTAGGHRRIPLSSAVEFLRRSGLSPVRPELLGLPAAGPVTMRDARDRTRAADRLVDALLEDRSSEARSLIVSSYVDGAGLAWLCDVVIREALARIGELWEHGPEGIFLEHRATDTCLRALAELRPLLPPAPPLAPVAVGGGFDGDGYQVPSAMAALVLAEVGYRDRNLGALTPVDATLAAVARYRPRLVWQSFSVAPERPREAARSLDRLARAVAPGALVVGGRAVAEVALPELENVHRLESMAELSAFARGAAVSGDG
jgi:MerR family transcriptional regulator, light-induced transcriptional regulator